MHHRHSVENNRIHYHIGYGGGKWVALHEPHEPLEWVSTVTPRPGYYGEYLTISTEEEFYLQPNSIC